MKEKLGDWFRHTALLALGSALCALAVKAILIPQGFLSSGLTGAALIIYYRYPVVSVEVLYLLINIPVFLLGWRFAGLRFVLYSLWGMLIYALMLFLISYQAAISDPMLGAVVAGGCVGLGIAIILRSYGSTGGSEVLCVVMNKLFSISVGTGALLINAVVLTVSTLLFPMEKVLYTLVYAVVSTQATDFVFHGLARRQAALIISNQWEVILHKLTHLRRIGVTRIDGRGGFGGSDRTILYSVVQRKDIAALKRMVLEEDPKAFIALMPAEDVTGVRVGNQPHW